MAWNYVSLTANDSSPSVMAANGAALSAMLASKGRYVIPPGDYYCDPFDVMAPCVVSGSGSSNAYGPIGDDGSTAGKIAATKLICKSGTADFVTIRSGGVQISEIAFENQASSKPTAGTAIHAGPTSSVAADGFQLRNCSFYSFYDQLLAGNAAGYSITNNVFYRPVHSGLKISNYANVDEGDPAIIGNIFASGATWGSNPLAAILFKQGGGPKIIGNKIFRAPPTLGTTGTNVFLHGIHISPNSGVFTGVFPICGNSIEGILTNGIFLDASGGGTGYIGKIVIVGNEFFSGSTAIRAVGTATYPWQSLVIDGNAIDGFLGGIYLKYVEGVTIGPTTFKATSQQGWLQLDVGCEGVSFDLGSIGYIKSASPLLMYTDADSGNVSNLHRGTQRKALTREIPNAGTIGDAVALWRIDLEAQQAARVVLDLTANVNGIGAYVAGIEIAATADGAGNITASTIGSEYNSGTKLIDWIFDVATAGRMTIKIQTKTDVGIVQGNGLANGQVSMDCRGRIKALYVHP